MRGTKLGREILPHKPRGKDGGGEGAPPQIGGKQSGEGGGKGGRGDTETSTSYLGGKRGQGSGIVWSTHHFLTLSRAEQRNHNTSQLLDEAWRVELDPWNNF